MQINANRNRYPGCPIPIRDLIDHYVQTDLSSEDGWHSHATRTVYRQFLKKWIIPHWGEVALHSVRTLAVEHWLKGLKRTDGTDLAGSTKAKIRNIFSVLFNHAIRCEWLEQGRNPITFVRQSAKRNSIPVVLEPHEVPGTPAGVEALLSNDGRVGGYGRIAAKRAVRSSVERCELF